LGVIGILVPVLPTTPFLLVAAFFFARSSDRFYHWLVNNRWFGEYIRNYREGRGIPLREKVVALTLMWLTIILAVIYTVEAWWVRTLLVAIAIGVTIHLVRLPTYRGPVEGEGGTAGDELGFDSE
jgi:uncharacterized membrane protein YbaN (DUF454 family)